VARLEGRVADLAAEGRRVALQQIGAAHEEIVGHLVLLDRAFAGQVVVVKRRAGLRAPEGRGEADLPREVGRRGVGHRRVEDDHLAGLHGQGRHGGEGLALHA
jgi:hypothetical protein